MRPRRRLGCLASVLVAAGLLGTHGWVQYGPRERAGAPVAGGLPDRLLEDRSFDLALWLAYPHQNLAVFRRELGGEGPTREWAAAVLRLAEVRSRAEPEISLPAFGPFPVPPARELTLAIGEAGERSRSPAGALLAARVYPALVWIGRSAGAIAGNPWLSGGEVRAFGQPARVSWDGAVWRVASEAADPGALAAARTVHGGISREPALARLRVGSGLASGGLPAGGYRLFRPRDAPTDLELALEGPRNGEKGVPEETWEADPFEALGPELAAAGVAAAWAQGTSAQGSRGGRVGLVLLYHGGGRGRLPPMAVLAPASTPASTRAPEAPRRLRLLQERLPSFLREELERAPAGPWLALASDEDALAAACRLAARLPRPEALPDRFLWVDLPALRGLVDTVVELLEDVPLFPRGELRRWRDVRTAMGPLEGFGRLTLLSRPERPPQPRWRLRLHRRQP
jgi:hypothetical protein